MTPICMPNFLSGPGAELQKVCFLPVKNVGASGSSGRVSNDLIGVRLTDMFFR